MKVSVQKFAVTMDLGNDGITLDVREPSGTPRLGDLRIGKATIEWCRGKTANGVKKSWTDLIAWFEEGR